MTVFSAQSCLDLATKGVKVSPTTIVNGSLVLKSPCSLAPHCYVSNSVVDSFSSIANYANIENSNIGKYCTIDENVYLGLANHDIDNIATKNIFLGSTDYDGCRIEFKRTETSQHHKAVGFTKAVVEHDVHIGFGVQSTSNVTIGSGAVIRPKSIITKDIPPYAIVEDVNHIVGYRFSDEVISDLLEIQWWNYNLPKMLQQGIKLPLDNPVEFIRRFQELEPSQLIPLEEKVFNLNLYGKNVFNDLLWN